MKAHIIAKCALLGWVLFLFSGWLPADNPDIIILKEEKQNPAQVESEQPLENEEQPNATGSSFSAFYERWRAFEIVYAEGNRERQDKLLHEMQNWRESHAIPAMPQFAASLLETGNSELQQNHKEDALRLYRAATEFDPSFSQAYFSEAKIYLKGGIGTLIPAARAAFQGILAPRATLSGKIQWYSKYMLLLVATLIISAFLFSLILMIKYFRLLRHDFQEKLSNRYHGVAMEFAIWILLFLPVLLFLGPLWLAPFWIMIFWPYARIPEKAISLIFVASFIVAFPAYQRASQLSRAYQDPLTAAYITAFSNGASPKSISDFQEYSTRNPRDQDAYVLLAYLYKTDHQMPAAIEVLQKHMLSSPSDARTYNNLGNLYFINGEIESAIRLIQRASDLDTSNAIYAYNLSKLQRAKFNFSEAQRLMDRAQRLDPVLVDNQEGLPQEKLIDAVPSYELVWKRIDQESGRIPDLFKNPFSITGLVLLFLTFVIALNRSTIAHGCSKCGKPFCNKCQSSSKRYNYCTQCLHIFVKKDGVSPISRKEKMREIDRHSRQQSFYMKLSSLLIPGSGSIFENRTFFGILILVLWFFVLCFLFFERRLPFLSYFEPSQSFSVVAPFCIFILAVLYLIANLSFLKKLRA